MKDKGGKGQAFEILHVRHFRLSLGNLNAQVTQ
jgi:hypothetical protein